MPELQEVLGCCANTLHLIASKHDTEKLCNTADEVLEYEVGDVRLRDVITQVTVWSRTI